MKNCDKCLLVKALVEKIEDKREIIRNLTTEKSVVYKKSSSKFNLLLPN